MIVLGDQPVNSTVYCHFNTYNSAGASCTISGLAVTDIEIYRDASQTQRASDNGYTLIDTDGIDLDGSVGLHGFQIDLSDNSDSGFYVSGSHFLINVDAITVDSQTVRFSFSFTIGRLLRPATAGRTVIVDGAGLVDANAVKIGPTGAGTAQTARDLGTSVLISSGTGTGQLSVTSGVVASNMTQIGGTTQSATDLKDFADTGYDPATHKVQGVVLVDTTTDVTTKSGYSLSGTQTFNNTGTWTGSVSGSVGSVTAGVTVTTNNDKTGYALSGTQTFNNTGTWTGTVTTVTTLTNLPTIPANWLTAAGIAAGAFTNEKFDDDCLAGQPVGSVEGDVNGDIRGRVIGDPVATGVAILGIGAWVAGASGAAVSTLDAAGIRAAIGQSSANFDTITAAIKAAVDAILADTGTDGVVLSAAVRNQIADNVIRRTLANVKASSDGDTPSQRSLYGALNMMFRSSISGTTQTVRDVDGTTLGTFTLTLGSGGEITSIVFAS